MRAKGSLTSGETNLILKSNHVAAGQCKDACNYRSRGSVTVHIKCRQGCDLGGFDCGMVGTKWLGLPNKNNGERNTKKGIEMPL